MLSEPRNPFTNRERITDSLLTSSTEAMSSYTERPTPQSDQLPNCWASSHRKVIALTIFVTSADVGQADHCRLPRPAGPTLPDPARSSGNDGEGLEPRR